jgi:hypothetical protein
MAKVIESDRRTSPMQRGEIRVNDSERDDHGHMTTCCQCHKFKPSQSTVHSLLRCSGDYRCAPSSLEIKCPDSFAPFLGPTAPRDADPNVTCIKL